MKRILVLGATGDQGHPLLTRLIADDADCRPAQSKGARGDRI
jgi:uncharacterized protein YbjT (DUF2867 family)